MVSIRHFKLHKYVGLLHILFGVIILILEVIGIILDGVLFYFANGVYSGIFLITTGLIYLISGSKKSKCLLVTGLIFEITSIIVLIVALSLAAYEIYDRGFCRHQNCNTLYNRIKNGFVICVCCLELLICLIHVVVTCYELCNNEKTTRVATERHPPPRDIAAHRGSVVIHQNLSIPGADNYYSNRISTQIQGGLGTQINASMHLEALPEAQESYAIGSNNFSSNFLTQIQGGPRIETKISSPMEMSPKMELDFPNRNRPNNCVERVGDKDVIESQRNTPMFISSEMGPQHANVQGEFPPDPAIYYPPQNKVAKVQVSQVVRSPHPI